jgi:hypothetical protein
MPFDGMYLPGSSLVRFLAADRKLTDEWCSPRKQVAPEVAAQRRAGRVTRARATVVILDELQQLFDGGEKWIRGEFENSDGYCLVGGLRHLRKVRGKGDDAGQYLRRAIAKLADRYSGIMDFNDSRRSYAQVLAVIVHARELAARYIESDPGPLHGSGLHSL